MRPRTARSRRALRTTRRAVPTTSWSNKALKQAPREKPGILPGLLFFLLLPAAGRGAEPRSTLKAYAVQGDLAGVRLEGLEPAPAERGLLSLSPGRPGELRVGRAESGAVSAAFPFETLVPSWNVELSSGAELSMEVRVSSGEGWSDWVNFGSWSAEPKSDGRRIYPFGALEVDTLELTSPAVEFQWRVKLVNPDARPSLIRSFAFAYARKGEPPAETAASGSPIELDVPTRSQTVEQASYRRDICSPTSVGMVMAYWGAVRPTAAWAERVLDRTEGIYGHWPFNLAAAAEALPGIEARLAYLPSLTSLDAELKLRRPVVLSVTFKEGELTGSPIKRTRGHLFVARGLTATGDYIVNDPAASSDTVRRIYPRADIRRVWLERKRGVAYLIRPAWPRAAEASTEAELFAGEPGALSPAGLLPEGWAVRALGAQGDWVEVEPPSGTSSSRRRWLRGRDLRTPDR